MDPDYQLDAGTAALVANLTAGTPVVEEVAVVAATTLPTSLVESSSTIGTGPVFNSTRWFSSSPVTLSPPIPITVPITPAGQVGDSVGDLSKRLEEGLKQVQETLEHLNKSPAVVVINPPAATPAEWPSHVDTTTAASIAILAFCILLVVAGFLLRRFRPNTWQTVKAAGFRGLQCVALPASWAMSKAADALRRFHHSSTENVETGQQTAVRQV